MKLIFIGTSSTVIRPASPILLLLIVLFFPMPGLAADAIIELATSENDPAAQYFLGRRYAAGFGVKKDQNRAAKWYMKAAKQGHVKALYEMGQIYNKGMGIRKDFQTAYECFLKAARQGHVQAMYEIGNHYYSGLDGPADTERATFWYRMAAEKNHAGAQQQLGKILNGGIGIDANKAEGQKWLSLANQAKENTEYDPDAATFAKPASKPLKSVVDKKQSRSKIASKPVPAKATTSKKHKPVKMAKATPQKSKPKVDRKVVKKSKPKSTADTFPEAQLISYIKDFPSGPDIIKPELQYRVGMLYLKGKGLPQNTLTALTWLEKAAENKFANAQYTLGMMYKNGDGVTKNKSAARRWLKKAARRGQASAIRELDLLNAENKLSLNERGLI
jgi:TPR repeat protein